MTKRKIFGGSDEGFVPVAAEARLALWVLFISSSSERICLSKVWFESALVERWRLKELFPKSDDTLVMEPFCAN